MKIILSRGNNINGIQKDEARQKNIGTFGFFEFLWFFFWQNLNNVSSIRGIFSF
jgi:hypothetical protein